MNSILNIELKDGIVQIEMFDQIAPNHVEQIKRLASEGFYNGLTFHRVIEGFMAQGGCPIGNGTGDAGNHLNAEFNDITHDRGICSMARSASPNSASSQFFICLAPSPFLDQKYTVWGKVINGMEFVDNIKKGNKTMNGAVQQPDRMIRVWVTTSN